MALSRVKTWIAGEVLTASDLNAEFNNILNNARSLISPLTGSLDLDGNELILDGDADTSITSDTDDRIDLRLGGVDVFIFDGTTASTVNGFTFTGVITGARPRLSATGSDTNIGVAIRPKGTGAGASVVLEDGNGNEVLIADVATASAVNEVTVTNAATGNGPVLTASGGDTNVSITLKGKGTGKVVLGQATSTEVQLAADQPVTDSSGNELIKFTKTASAVNEVTVVNQATGNRPRLDASGGDSNVSLALRAKGTGEIVQEDNAGNNVGWAPRGYLCGLGLAINGSDATNDIDIAVGMCRDTGNLRNIVLASALTKQLDVAWAVGTNQGMLATGAAVGNNTYHIFVILRPDTGVVDVAADTSATGANIATNTNANYTSIRRIGSIRRSGGANVSFTQLGDEFLLSTPVQDITDNNPGNSAVTATLASIPTGVQFIAKFDAELFDGDTSATSKGVLFTSLDQSDTACSTSMQSLGSGIVGGAGADGRDSGQFHIRTNTSAQIRYRCHDSSTDLGIRIRTHGWIDRRGRDS